MKGCVAVPNNVEKYDFNEGEKEENQGNQEEEKSAGGRSNRENGIQETTCWDKMVYKWRKRYFGSWHGRRIVETMDVENSEEDNPEVEKGTK